MTDDKQKLKNGLIFQLAKIPTQFHKKERKKVLKKLKELQIQQLSEQDLSSVAINENSDFQLQSKVFNLKISKGKCSKKGVTFAIPQKKVKQEALLNKKLRLQAQKIHIDIQRLRNAVFEKFHIPNQNYTATSYFQKNFTPQNNYQVKTKQNTQQYHINPQTYRSSNNNPETLKRSKSAYEYKHIYNNTVRELPLQSQIKQETKSSYFQKSKSNLSLSKYNKNDNRTIDANTKSGRQRLNFQLELLKRKIELRTK